MMGNEYERVRARRIRENMAKLRQLGIKVATPTAATVSISKNINKKKPNPIPPNSMPRRTSSRLMKKPAGLMVKMNEEVSIGGDETYCRKKGKLIYKGKGDDDGHEEIYSSEHEKLLGDCKTPWEPSFDDRTTSKKRFYDSVNGTTCHQCRQKTVGLRTECNHCHLPHGRLCGNCLCVRYGENLLEAKENGNWSCLVCRGICNCSRCRDRKGLLPTGPIHHHAWNLGFKSVAHYLILSVPN